MIVKQNLENQKNELVQVTDKIKKNGQFRDSEIIMHFRNSADKQKAKRILQNLIAANSRQTGAYGSIRTTDNTFDPISSVRGLIQAVTAGIAITIVVAGFSLAVAMIGSFFERKKSFHNLRLMGLDIKSLNKVVLLESVLPLFLASIIATTAGLLVTYFMITTLNTNFAFSMPGWEYFAMIIGSIAITLMIIVATLPILKRITELEQNRTE